MFFLSSSIFFFMLLSLSHFFFPSELNVLLVGSNSPRKNLVGNIILGKQAFKSDVTACYEKGEGEVCGRRVTLVKVPGWLRGYDFCNTPELFETEAILSVTDCTDFYVWGSLLTLIILISILNKHSISRMLNYHKNDWHLLVSLFLFIFCGCFYVFVSIL